jgi:2-dehydropantoate 2-reductase
LARGATLRSLQRNGIDIVDGLTGEHQTARPQLVDGLGPDDHFDLIVVAMQRSSRLAVCPTLARNPHVRNILFLGNDVEGFRRYLDHLPARHVLLGFPGVGGGWRGDELVIMEGEEPTKSHGEIFIGEIDGIKRRRTWEIGRLFEHAGIDVHIEPDMDGWLKYHFAFMAPTAGAILSKGGDLQAVAADRELIHDYCRACREAGNVLHDIGYRRRQPTIFNLYYWLPRWLEPKIFGKLFGSPASETRFGLHARTVGTELLELAEEFAVIARIAGMTTPTLDRLVDAAQRALDESRHQEVA